MVEVNSHGYHFLKVKIFGAIQRDTLPIVTGVVDIPAHIYGGSLARTEA